MKKILLLIAVPFVFFTALSAQITQKRADEIVFERIKRQEVESSIYAKKGVQTAMTIVTASGEEIELNYVCWVYYVSYANTDQSRYLIVKVSNGNLLEICTKNGAEPDDLAAWRVIEQIDVPFIEYFLSEYLCQWTNFESNKIIVINDNEEVRDYIVCTNGNHSEIDFSKYSLLLVRGRTLTGISYIDIDFSQETVNEYTVSIYIHTNFTAVVRPWLVSIVAPKINNESIITLNIQEIR